MPRVLIVANRLPLVVEKRRGRSHFEPSVGGLATALGSYYKSQSSLWIGWPGIELEKVIGEEGEIEAKLQTESCRPVFLTEQDIEGFYHGFCNKTLWPLFHYFPEYAVYNQDFWHSYEQANQTFCKVVVETARDDDIIWIHDYQLMLLPRLIRDKLPGATIGFFLHIPFPSFEIFRLLPWRKQILNGLLGADMVGFHTYDYVWHFLDSVHNLLGYEATMGQITTTNRVLKADVFPLGIDYERYARAAKGAKGAKVRTEISKFRDMLGNYKIILSIDRLDYTKGIPKRLEAFSIFLENHPEYREKIILVLVVVPSRTRVEHYAQLKRQIDELVGAINGKYGSIGWTPIWYLYRSLPFEPLIALYNMADIALVTPLRDGMNLIAKEYVATRVKGRGVLILSETAGAVREMGEAITINVNNPEEIAQALEEALAMPKKEQIERNRAMQKRLQHYNVKWWAEEFINQLKDSRKMQDEIESRALTIENRNMLLDDFQKSQRRLLLLDYDGTLVPFAEKPSWAKPTGELKGLLKKLSRDPHNEVVLISGRDRHNLTEWFDRLNIGKVAEHGAWTRAKGGEWEMMGGLTGDWKEKVRPVIEMCVDRTPGSLIEEKEFSLAWHYREVTPMLGDQRARELVNDLLNLTSNLNLNVIEGSKVVEVKNAGVNKGRASMRWISGEEWGFILAIGDDVTDEDTFKALPPSAWSIKVRFSASAAKFNLGSPLEVIELLKQLSKMKKARR